MPDSGEAVPSAPPAKQRLTSRRLNTVTCVAGLVTAATGLLGVLTHAGGNFDVVLLLVGLLVALVGLVLRGRSPRT